MPRGDRDEPLDLALLRDAAEAGFHATPPTVLALLDLIEHQARIIALYLRRHPPFTADTQLDATAPSLHAVPNPPDDTTELHQPASQLPLWEL